MQFFCPLNPDYIYKLSNSVMPKRYGKNFEHRIEYGRKIFTKSKRSNFLQ